MRCAVLACIAAAAAAGPWACVAGASRQIPDNFLGSWEAVPDYSVMGPFSATLGFQIEAVPAGGYLIWDLFQAETLVPTSFQRFWIADNTLHYCGQINNFFDQGFPGQADWWFTLDSVNSTFVRWCSTKGGCSEVQWTFEVLGPDTMHTRVLFPDPVRHLDATFTRRPGSDRNPTVAPRALEAAQAACNFTSPSPPPATARAADAAPVRKRSACPFHHLHKRGAAKDGAAPAPATPYQHCYIMNVDMDYRLEWNFDSAGNNLDVRVSAPASPSAWIAFGFAPTFPAMAPADIALGYMDASSRGCVRTMAAEEYVGTPVDSTRMKLSSEAVSLAGGRMTLEFSRALDTGATPIPFGNEGAGYPVMFAVGPDFAPLSNCTSTPIYHFNKRGLRNMDWAAPDKSFASSLRC